METHWMTASSLILQVADNTHEATKWIYLAKMCQIVLDTDMRVFKPQTAQV
jgi:hypothetical protein